MSAHLFKDILATRIQVTPSHSLVGWVLYFVFLMGFIGCGDGNQESQVGGEGSPDAEVTGGGETSGEQAPDDLNDMEMEISGDSGGPDMELDRGAWKS